MAFHEILRFDDRDHEALMGVWWTGLLLKQQARRFFQAYGLSEAQFNILILLRYAEAPLTQRELGERLLVDKSNITGLCGRMEEAGLITRRTDPGDQRAYALALTEAGNVLLDQAEAPYRERVRRIMAGFSEAELETLTALAARMQKGIREVEA